MNLKVFNSFFILTLLFLSKTGCIPVRDLIVPETAADVLDNGIVRLLSLLLVPGLSSILTALGPGGILLLILLLIPVANILNIFLQSINPIGQVGNCALSLVTALPTLGLLGLVILWSTLPRNGTVNNLLSNNLSLPTLLIILLILGPLLSNVFSTIFQFIRTWIGPLLLLILSHFLPKIVPTLLASSVLLLQTVIGPILSLIVPSISELNQFLPLPELSSVLMAPLSMLVHILSAVLTPILGLVFQFVRKLFLLLILSLVLSKTLKTLLPASVFLLQSVIGPVLSRIISFILNLDLALPKPEPGSAVFSLLPIFLQILGVLTSLLGQVFQFVPTLLRLLLFILLSFLSKIVKPLLALLIPLLQPAGASIALLPTFTQILSALPISSLGQALLSPISLLQRVIAPILSLIVPSISDLDPPLPKPDPSSALMPLLPTFAQILGVLTPPLGQVFQFVPTLLRLLPLLILSFFLPKILKSLLAPLISLLQFVAASFISLISFLSILNPSLPKSDPALLSLLPTFAQILGVLISPLGQVFQFVPTLLRLLPLLILPFFLPKIFKTLLALLIPLLQSVTAPITSLIPFLLNLDIFLLGQALLSSPISWLQRVIAPVLSLIHLFLSNLDPLLPTSAPSSFLLSLFQNLVAVPISFLGVVFEVIRTLLGQVLQTLIALLTLLLEFIFLLVHTLIALLTPLLEFIFLLVHTLLGPLFLPILSFVLPTILWPLITLLIPSLQPIIASILSFIVYLLYIVGSSSLSLFTQIFSAGPRLVALILSLINPFSSRLDPVLPTPDPSSTLLSLLSLFAQILSPVPAFLFGSIFKLVRSLLGPLILIILSPILLKISKPVLPLLFFWLHLVIAPILSLIVPFLSNLDPPPPTPRPSSGLLPLFSLFARILGTVPAPVLGLFGLLLLLFFVLRTIVNNITSTVQSILYLIEPSIFTILGLLGRPVLGPLATILSFLGLVGPVFPQIVLLVKPLLDYFPNLERISPLLALILDAVLNILAQVAQTLGFFFDLLEPIILFVADILL